MDNRPTSRRGRPKKERPKLGETVRPGMSQRDIALALGVSRQELASWLDLAAIPEDEFDRLVKSDDFNFTKVKYLARLRANKATSYERKCPHCGGLLRIEGQATLEALLDDSPKGRARRRPRGDS
jgi:hypothetical protein